MKNSYCSSLLSTGLVYTKHPPITFPIDHTICVILTPTGKDYKE